MLKSYFWKRAFLCVYIIEPQIYILLFNKLDSYKVLINYKILQEGYSDSDIERRRVLWATIPHLINLEPSSPSFGVRNLLDLLWTLKHTLELD